LVRQLLAPAQILPDGVTLGARRSNGMSTSACARRGFQERDKTALGPWLRMLGADGALAQVLIASGENAPRDQPPAGHDAEKKTQPLGWSIGIALGGFGRREAAPARASASVGKSKARTRRARRGVCGEPFKEVDEGARVKAPASASNQRIDAS
jgi:hypothetical protein